LWNCLVVFFSYLHTTFWDSLCSTAM